MKLTKKNLEEALTYEIKWCKNNPCPESIDKESFILGIKQAIYIVKNVGKETQKNAY